MLKWCAWNIIINVAFCFVVKIYNEIEIEFKATLESLDCVGWMLIKSKMALW